MSDALVDAALENLVNQFARPLDFLRELAQNSIDAGSPRVEVRIARAGAAEGGGEALLAIHVDDWGEGMDERIIDTQLTRLFSSTKEDDLTKIGKFGIGFTSIFAIRPEAVLLRTGRHGESWELLFHPDRSFEKVRLDEPVAGTKITLFKRLPEAEVPGFVAECEWVLRFWCEHSGPEILFQDLSAPAAAAEEPAADPFAAFQNPIAAAPLAQPQGPRRINGPLRVDAPLCHALERDGVQVMVGIGAPPRYGFYNGGLTLVHSEHDEVLGPFAPRLRHLVFKVKYDRLEHTLTRDNVLQDQHWTRAMKVVEEAALALYEALFARLAERVRTGLPLDEEQAWLAQACRATAIERRRPELRRMPVARDVEGRAVDLESLDRANSVQGAVLLAPEDPSLTRALVAEGILLVEDRPALRRLLEATWRPPLFRLRYQPRQFLPADALFQLALPVEARTLDPVAQALLHRAQVRVRAALGARVELRPVRGLGGGATQLVLEGMDEGRLYRITDGRRSLVPRRWRRTRIGLNIGHPAWSRLCLWALDLPEAASLALAQLLLEAVEEKDERAWVAALEAHP